MTSFPDPKAAARYVASLIAQQVNESSYFFATSDTHISIKEFYLPFSEDLVQLIPNHEWLSPHG